MTTPAPDPARAADRRAYDLGFHMCPSYVTLTNPDRATAGVWQIVDTPGGRAGGHYKAVHVATGDRIRGRFGDFKPYDPATAGPAPPVPAPLTVGTLCRVAPGRGAAACVYVVVAVLGHKGHVLAIAGGSSRRPLRDMSRQWLYPLHPADVAAALTDI